MPYKHIAAQLNKTELACRLHYHQMSYGGNRRRRSDSVSSTGSFSSAITGLRDPTPDTTRYTQLSPVPSPPSSPDMCADKNEATSEASRFPSHRAPVPILPKPYSSSSSPSLSTTKLSDPFHVDPYTSQQQLPYPLRTDQRAFVDPSRLRTIYEAHRHAFWSRIALEYAPDSSVSGRQVEETFFRCCNMASTTARDLSPPTPGPSPEEKLAPVMYHHRQTTTSPLTSRSDAMAIVEEPQGFCAVNHTKQSTPDPLSDNHLDNNSQESSSLAATTTSALPSSSSCADRCAVSALLTVEQEVRTAQQVK